MATIDPATITAAAAARLAMDVTPELDTATEAAFQYIENDTGIGRADEPGGFDDTDALITNGLILMTMRIFQDTPTVSGSLTGFDNDVFGGVVVPTRLYSHLDQYYDHLRENFGVA